MHTLRRLATLAALFALAAHAGITVTTEMKRKDKTSRMVMQLEGKSLRGEMLSMKDGAAVPEGAFIHDGQGRRMIIINYQEKKYHEISEEQMKQWRSKMEAARAQMKAQLDKMPPERRAQMEAMMERQMKTTSPVMPDEKFVRASGSKKIAGYSCDLYTVESNGEHIADTCLIPWADLKLDREQIKQNLESLKEMWGVGGADKTPSPVASWTTAPGVPAWRKTVKPLEEGGHETTLISISQGAVPKEAFAPPAGMVKSQPRGME